MSSNFTLGPINTLVLLGGGPLVVHLIDSISNKGLKVRVVTSPRYASQKVNGVGFLEFLSSNKIDCLVTESIGSSQVKSFLSELEDPLYLSIGAPWIFKQSAIENLFQEKLLNLHGTRLPQNRGGGGFSWQIMMGYRFGCCLIHRIDEGIDTGDVVEYADFIYPPTTRIPIEFESIYIERNLEFLSSFIEKYRYDNHVVDLKRQPEYLSTYWPRLNTPVNAAIDWSLSPEEVERFICAFDKPYSGAFTLLGDDVVRIRSVQLSSGDGAFHPFQTGLVFRVLKDYCIVALAGKSLIIGEVLDSSGKNIVSKIAIGSRFRTSYPLYFNSLTRPTYGPLGLISDN